MFDAFIVAACAAVAGFLFLLLVIVDYIMELIYKFGFLLLIILVLLFYFLHVL